jgi:hypothetical protein
MVNKEISFDDTVYNGEWLEDKGRFSRFAIGNEESVWVCMYCEAIDVDPHEDVCDC